MSILDDINVLSIGMTNVMTFVVYNFITA